MSHTKPFHRNYRPFKSGGNMDYIVEPEYACNGSYYVRALLLIQKDLESLFEYLEPSDECKTAYSYRIHSLLMRTCIEVEANFRAILNENICSSTDNLTMPTYKKVEITHHLSSYKIELPIWNGVKRIFRPFEVWQSLRTSPPNYENTRLPWYEAYNASKHNRQEAFKDANFEMLINAVAGLLILVSSQFRDEDFSAKAGKLLLSHNNPMKASTGGLFTIEYPSEDDWTDDEKYDFDWTKSETNGFVQYDYNQIPGPPKRK